MTEKQAHQNRTAIVHFGATTQDYLDLVQAPLTAQLSSERHKPDCRDTSRYTLHALRERQVDGWDQSRPSLSAERAVEPSSRSCPASPSNRHLDDDCLGKLQELNLGMGLSQRVE
ncbi:hypothetical protein HRE53_00005 [Acaryochloris sp. 'Moss Beach']|uniref:hypothetical protein n=1 Tax=Acaryochloris sp. 'Moss Beach' TaxID=2740837 RepID=UPI001F312EF6|nr:hypothetical protein [Acaryochloris sp. 'Moss Beach']UJB69669.1 hypothetical protein HRE53_25830 [Acaryochloris sp. 'Moss Beach']UJB69670.1 hypothetical protein HRE53_00005 [Acaryochloris sp. 'Moss Beach']